MLGAAPGVRAEIVHRPSLLDAGRDDAAARRRDDTVADGATELRDTRMLGAVPGVLTPLALIATVFGLVFPSGAFAARSDLLLALLVLATALGISFADLRRLREHLRAVLILSLAPLPALVGAAWLLGRPFAPLVRDGLLAVGLSSAEVASVGLVALAERMRRSALGVVTGSLVLSPALVEPLAIGWLSGSEVHVGSAHLLGRFALSCSCR